MPVTDTSTSLWPEERMLIGGSLIEAADGVSFANVNPATEEVIGRVADGAAADMDAAIAAARRRLRDTAWSTDAGLRLRCLAAARGRCSATPRSCGDSGRRGRLPGLLTYGPQLDVAASTAWLGRRPRSRRYECE